MIYWINLNCNSGVKKIFEFLNDWLLLMLFVILETHSFFHQYYLKKLMQN